MHQCQSHVSSLRRGILAFGTALACASTGFFGPAALAAPAISEEQCGSQEVLCAQDSWDSSRYRSTLGSVGFFQWEKDTYGTDSSANMDLIIAEITGRAANHTPTSSQLDPYGKTYLSYTKLGDADDATSLENMKLALDYLKEGNEKRAAINAEYGLSAPGQTMVDGDGIEHTYLEPFMVSDYCMVAAQIRSNWSTAYEEHAPKDVYGLTEVLAWTHFTNPYVLWYDNELETIREVKAEHPGDPNWQDYLEGRNVGHYYSFVNPDFRTAGFGVNTSVRPDPEVVRQTCCELFSPETQFVPYGDNALSLDEYYNRFMTYYEAVKAHETEIPYYGQAMYRLYNPHSGEHFYTGSGGERELLIAAGWKNEGIAWIAVNKRYYGAPVYRLYNVNGGDHHYTMSEGERDLLVAAGWRDEGVGWLSSLDEEKPVYRQYNKNAKTGAHNFTTSKGERDLLVAQGWRDEGIAWYGLE